MLASSFIDLHFEGGIEFMFPLFLMLIANSCILIYTIITRIKKNELNSKWLDAIKQIGGLAAAYGAFGTVFGLIQAFNALETSPEVIPFPVICGGLKVAALNVVYGLLILFLSQLAYIILKLSDRPQPSHS